MLLTAALVTARFTAGHTTPTDGPVLSTAIGSTYLFKLGFCVIVKSRRGTEEPTAQVDKAVIVPRRLFNNALYTLLCTSLGLRVIMRQYKCDISPYIGRFSE